MPDVFTTKKRSEIMSHIQGCNTGPERNVRKILHKMGYRFRLHRSDLPGKPDIVLPKYRTVIMVHGCFWHRHKGCRYAYTPKSRVEFWAKKFESNMSRDRIVKKKLQSIGWHIITVWQCEIRSPMLLGEKLDTMLKRNLDKQVQIRNIFVTNCQH